MAKARLKDIAQQVGVSESTVSRVLNGRAGIAPETQQLVRDAARDLGGLSASGGEHLIGILVPDLENPIFATWVDRIEAELYQGGAATLVQTRARTVPGERAAFARFARAGARGVVVISGFHARAHDSVDHYRDLQAEGIRLALVNGVREDLNASYFSTDDAAAIQLAVTHLQELGHRAIGLAVGDEHTFPVRGKVRAFEELIAQSPSAARSIAFTDFSFTGGYEAARELVGQGNTAIVCGSDVMAAGAVAGARSLGLQVPTDLSVVGFDDIAWARLTSPPLTTLRQDVALMSRAVARIVLGPDTHDGSQAGSRRPERTESWVSPQLIVRGSTAAAPDRGPRV
jgi:DNA-binding LacI/PurR family transcriptional regulator